MTKTSATCEVTPSRGFAVSGDERHCVAEFLAEYASWLLGCGATCQRIEKNTRRMARVFGYNFDISIMPAHVYVSIWRENAAKAVTVMHKAAACGINFALNASLSRLSWIVADNGLGYATAMCRFRKMINVKPTDKWEVLLLASLANASFCRLFGGDLVAMAIVFVSTCAGLKLKQIMTAEGRDVRLVFLCASFFSAAISAGGHVFSLGTTPEVALGTSVLYLIPGVPYINAVIDMLDRHYLCAFSRVIDAFVLTVCLSVGLCAGMLILGLKWF